MAITVNPGTQVRRGGTFQSTESLSAVTSTATQTISLTTPVTEITGSTATVTNYYTLGAGHEGQEKYISYLATAAGGDGTSTGGDVQILATSWRNTSSITFRNAGQWWFGKFLNGAWIRMAGTTYEEHWASSTVDVIDGGASGALPLTVDAIRFNGVTGTDQVYTLADGYEGQRVMLIGPVGTTVRTITPATMNELTSISFGGLTASGNAGTMGDAQAELQFMHGGWTLISSPWIAHATLTATMSAFNTMWSPVFLPIPA